MKANSFYVDSFSAIKPKIEQIIANDFKPGLAIVFASVKHNFKQIADLFNNLNIDLVGCSSSGEIVNDSLFEDRISVLVLDINKAHYKILHQEIKDSYSNLKNFGTECVNTFKNSALLLFTGGITLNGAEIVKELKQAKPTDFPIYGGMAGDDLTYKNTFAFTNNWITKSGIVALVINNDKISVQGKCVSGWEGMGATHQITKSKGNVLYEIDNKPALEVYKDYFNFHTHLKKDILENNETFNSITAQYPLIMHKSDEYSIMRSPLISDFENNAIVLAGSVVEGDYFQFGIAPDYELLEKTTNEFKDLKMDIPEIDAAIMINCKGRQTALGPEISEEIEAIYKLWNTPTIGFFSYGEIGNVHNGGPCEFHNVTCSLATLTEI